MQRPYNVVRRHLPAVLYAVVVKNDRVYPVVQQTTCGGFQKYKLPLIELVFFSEVMTFLLSSPTLFRSAFAPLNDSSQNTVQVTISHPIIILYI